MSLRRRKAPDHLCGGCGTVTLNIFRGMITRIITGIITYVVTCIIARMFACRIACLFA